MEGLGISISKPEIAPILIGNLPVGNLNGIYSYCLTYITTFGETLNSKESEKIECKGTCCLLLPSSQDNNCKGKNLYRKNYNNGNSDKYKLIARINNGVLIYNDNGMPDINSAPLSNNVIYLNDTDTSSSTQLLKGYFYFDKPLSLSTSIVQNEQDIFVISHTYNIIMKQYPFDTVKISKINKDGTIIYIQNKKDSFIKCITSEKTLFYLDGDNTSMNLLRTNNEWIIL